MQISPQSNLLNLTWTPLSFLESLQPSDGTRPLVSSLSQNQVFEGLTLSQDQVFEESSPSQRREGWK